jgi:hypothetical protein
MTNIRRYYVPDSIVFITQVFVARPDRNDENDYN